MGDAGFTVHISKMNSSSSISIRCKAKLMCSEDGKKIKIVYSKGHITQEEIPMSCLKPLLPLPVSSAAKVLYIDCVPENEHNILMLKVECKDNEALRQVYQFFEKHVGKQERSKRKKICSPDMTSMNARSSSDRIGAPENKKRTIFIRRVVEEVFPVEIELTASVKRLKEEIQRQKQIQLENQLVDFAGVSLRDDQPLNAYGIEHNSHLHVMEKTRTRGWISLFVKTPKKTFPISLCAQCRLENLQKKLFELLGVDVQQQRIVFHGVLQTNPSEKLETFGHGSTLELHLPKITRVILCTVNDKKQYPLRIDDFNTGFEVKRKIFDLLRIIPSAQRVFIGDILMEDDVLMREYDLTEQSILNVHENTDAGKAIEITVKLPSEKEIKVKTDRQKSVYFLKQQIQKTEGVPLEKQDLLLKDRPLLDWKSLGESGVNNGSEINSKRNTKAKIFVDDLQQNVYALHVDLFDSISTVKDMVRAKTGIPADTQRLFYKGKQMEDDNTLINSKVKPDSTIHLMLSLRGC